MNISHYKKIEKGRRFYMIKTSHKEKIDYIVDIVESNSSNDWDELCNKCSSLIKDAHMTDIEIERIVKESKKV